MYKDVYVRVYFQYNVYHHFIHMDFPQLKSWKNMYLMSCSFCHQDSNRNGNDNGVDDDDDDNW